MNLFQLEYFIILAETLNYTKASQKLHISQPTLSKLIITLEHSIGSQLFIRNKRDVKLTSTGKVFYHEIKKTLNSYESAVQKVKDMESGTAGIINVGLLGTALVYHFPRIVSRFQAKHPMIKINPMDYSYHHMTDTLASGEIDIALLPDFEIDTSPYFLKKNVFTDHMCLVVHKDHKFSKHKSVSAAMIKDEPLINMDPKYSRTDHNLINHIFLREGFMPNTIYEASSLFNMMLMADCQSGVTILASHMQQFANDTLRFIPLKGFEDYFQVACIYNEQTNECIDKLLDVIDEYSVECSIT